MVADRHRPATPAWALFVALFALLQRHRNRLELLALSERHRGGGAAILQRRCDADRAEASAASQGLLHRCLKRPLRFRHRRALAPRSEEIFTLGDRLGLGELTGVVVYNHLEVLAIFHSVDGELQFAFLHLELGGKRLAVTGTRRQTTLEGHPSAQTPLGHRSLVPLWLVVVLGRER